MKDLICNAFCSSLLVHKVPCGYAVTAPFYYEDGDPITFYITHKANNAFRIEDDGKQVALIEANGIDLRRGARAEAFELLLKESSISFDHDTRILYTPYMRQDDLPRAALSFVTVLTRIQDLALLHPRIVRSTFRDDALVAIHEAFAGVTSVYENAPVHPELKSYRADVVIADQSTPPLALYFATSDEKALQALVLKMETEKYQQIPCRVALLMEKAKDNPLREATYSLAQARLDEVLSFRGVERDAMARLRRVYDQPLYVS